MIRRRLPIGIRAFRQIREESFHAGTESEPSAMKNNRPAVEAAADHTRRAELDAATRSGSLAAVIRQIAERTDPDFVILFGSQARKNAGECSDIDVMVVKDTDELHALAREAEEAVEQLDERIDVVPTTPMQLANCETAASAVYEDAMREGRMRSRREATRAGIPNGWTRRR